MSKIVFFSIPSYEHTNPSIEVVGGLYKKGNEVWYYSYNTFKEKIEDTSAKYIETDTFSDKLVFVGPSIEQFEIAPIFDKKKPFIYISLGSVVTKNKGFYRNCIKTFENKSFDVIMSTGKDTTLESLGKIPPNIEVKKLG